MIWCVLMDNFYFNFSLFGLFFPFVAHVLRDSVSAAPYFVHFSDFGKIIYPCIYLIELRSFLLLILRYLLIVVLSE